MRQKGGWRRPSSLARQGHRQRARHGLFRRTDQRKVSRPRRTAGDCSIPWGYLGRGYVLPSDDTADRLRRQLKTYYIVMLVGIVGTSGFRAFITSAAVAGVCIIFYAIWASRQVAGLQPAGEAMTFGESSAAQARAFGRAHCGCWKSARCCSSPAASSCTSPTRPSGPWRWSRRSSLAAVRWQSATARFFAGAGGRAIVWPPRSAVPITAAACHGRRPHARS